MGIQRHRKIYRESQQNAGLCAQFLKSAYACRTVYATHGDIMIFVDFAEILVPLSQSEDLTIDQKKLMIGKFLEVRSNPHGCDTRDNYMASRSPYRQFQCTSMPLDLMLRASASWRERLNSSRAKLRAP